jgi:hypothetical protein
MAGHAQEHSCKRRELLGCLAMCGLLLMCVCKVMNVWCAAPPVFGHDLCCRLFFRQEAVDISTPARKDVVAHLANSSKANNMQHTAQCMHTALQVSYSVTMPNLGGQQAVHAAANVSVVHRNRQHPRH